MPPGAVPPCGCRVLGLWRCRLVPARTARFSRIWQTIWQTLRCRHEHRTVAEKVRIVLDRAGHVAHVHDAVIGHVDHHNHGAHSAGAGDEMSARHHP